MAIEETTIYAQSWKPLGKQIWIENRRLTSDGVVIYSERGNDDYRPNMEAEKNEENTGQPSLA